MPNPSSAEKLAELGQRYWDLQIESDPFFATTVGEHRLDDRVPDISVEGLARQLATYRQLHGETRDLDPADLTRTQRTDREVLEESLAIRVGDLALETHLWKVDPLMGPQILLADVVRFHPTREARDLENLLARYRAFPQYLDQHVAGLRRGVESGRVAPRPCVVRVLGQLAALGATEEGSAHLLVPLAKMPAGCDDLAAAIRRSLKEDVLPAFARLETYLEKEYLACARSDAGLWSIPGGEETYRHLIRKYTTTPYSAEEIHMAGHAMVGDVMRELAEIAGRLGHSGSPLDFVREVKRNKANFATSREQLLRSYTETFERAQAALPAMFGRLPRTACEIRPIEPYAEKDAPGAYYYPPPSDGSRAGIFYANTYEPTSRALHEIETLTFHEAVPGHHLQIALGVENPALAQYRRYEPFDAFCEGWALYAEKLSDEMGLFSSDLSRVGLLNAQALRACRLVVDTGMHALKWSRDQAVKFMSENISLSPHVIEVEIDRYTIWPGQALSYSMGMRRIGELRQEAAGALADRMDLRAFHDLVLEEGAIPLTVLAGRVKTWIDERKNR